MSRAEQLGLLRADPPRLALVHPLLRSEVDLFEPAAHVRAVHRAIADTLRRDTDLERRAWHVSRSVEGPDAVAADLLAEAASRALTRGDPSAAGISFLRAGELSESVGAKVARLGEAGDALALAGQAARAKAAFDLALEWATDPTTRGALLLRRLIPIAEMSADPSLVEEMDEAITAIETTDRPLAAALAVYSALPAFSTGSATRAAEFLTRARSLSTELDAATELAARGLEAIVALFRGDAESRAPDVARDRGDPGDRRGARASRRTSPTPCRGPTSSGPRSTS